MATEIPNGLSKIGKKKKKFLEKRYSLKYFPNRKFQCFQCQCYVIFRLKDCDPSKIEELLKGGTPQTDIVKSFKNKPNKKRKKKKKGGQVKPDVNQEVEMRVDIPKNAAEASSNWASLVRSSTFNQNPHVLRF